MLKHLRATIIGLVCGLTGFAAAQTMPTFSGGQDPSQLFNYLNQIIIAGNQRVWSYITFNQAGEIGEMSFLSPVKVSGTSIAIIMPNGAARYIQTSATP